MVIVAGLIGALVGWAVFWLSDVLPRFAVAGAPPDLPPPTPPVPALWALVRRIAAGQPSPDMAQRWFALQLGTEVLTAFALEVLWLSAGLSAHTLVIAGSFIFFALIALIDIKYRLVPNLLTYPAIIGLLVLYGLILRQDMRFVLLGGGFAFSIFAFTAWIRPGKLGGGDVKLAALIGVAFGFPQVMYALLIGGGLGGAVSVALLVSRRATPDYAMPYAPFLCLGAMTTLLINWVTMLNG